MGHKTAGGVEVFKYPAGPDTGAAPLFEGWGGEEPEEEEAAQPLVLEDEEGRAAEAAERAEFEKRIAEESRKAFEAGRERGKLEGQQAEREAQAAASKAADDGRKRQVAEFMDRFAQERDRYLNKVEHEVVELALAVSARILRREAQMDPLLLTGAVRVALGQLSGSTQVRLRVPAEDLELWTEAMALFPNLALKPTVLAGEGMRLGDCMIEADMGSVDLGIRAQLGEIERGFFDRAPGRRTEAHAHAQGQGSGPGQNQSQSQGQGQGQGQVFPPRQPAGAETRR